jgi:hypothetical protein
MVWMFSFSIKEFLISVAANIAAANISGSDMIGYLIVFICIVGWIIGWHRRRMVTGKRGMDSWYFIALSFLVAAAAVGSGAYGIGLRSAPNAQAGKADVTAPKTNSILNSNRFYSSQNKEDVSGRLDRISAEINKADKEMFVPANQVLIQRFLVRPVGDAKENLEKLDQIDAAAKGMDEALYDGLLANERDYRVEVNALLFPKEPFVNFRLAAHEYRNSIAVWMKLAGGASDAETGQQLRDTVSASARSFGSARDEFLKWLTAKQDLIAKTRRELRS